MTDSLNISPSKIDRFVDWGNHHYYYSTDELNTAVRSEERNAIPYDNVTTLLHGLTTTKITQEYLSETTDKLKELIEKYKAKVPPLKVKQSNSLIELNHYIKNAIKADWLVFKSQIVFNPLTAAFFLLSIPLENSLNKCQNSQESRNHTPF